MKCWLSIDFQNKNWFRDIMSPSILILYEDVRIYSRSIFHISLLIFLLWNQERLPIPKYIVLLNGDFQASGVYQCVYILHSMIILFTSEYVIRFL